MDKTGKGNWKVYIIESESGWGQRIDEEKSFATETEAKKFVIKYNSKNDLPEVPDWYMYAQDPVFFDKSKGPY